MEPRRSSGPIDPYDRLARGAAGAFGVMLMLPLLLSFVYAWVLLAVTLQGPDNAARDGRLDSVDALGSALLGLLWGVAFFVVVGAGLSLVGGLLRFAGTGTWLRRRTVVLTVFVPGALYLVVMSALLVLHFVALG